MATVTEGREALHQKVSALIAGIESGSEEEVASLIDDLTRMRESDLFRQMGQLTRQLHDALNSFQLDANLSSVAEHAIPDAKARLDYVIEKTEEAAHRTLGAVEDTVPVAERLGDQARSLAGEWQRFRSREMSADEFRALSGDLSRFFGDVQDDVETISARLGEVLMAQEYQDLTGQVIRRVIDLVQEVEDNLVGMIRMRRNGSAPAVAPVATPGPGNGAGPVVGKDADAGVVNGQDDVDDLLSSLGF